MSILAEKVKKIISALNFSNKKKNTDSDTNKPYEDMNSKSIKIDVVPQKLKNLLSSLHKQQKETDSETGKHNAVVNSESEKGMGILSKKNKDFISVLNFVNKKKNTDSDKSKHNAVVNSESKKRMGTLSKTVKGIITALNSSNHKENNTNADTPATIVNFESGPSDEEIERYWVDKPYAFISILKNAGTKNLTYSIVEPDLGSFEKSLLDEVRFMIGDILTLKEISDLDDITMDDKTQLLRKKTAELLSDYPELNSISFERIFYYIRRDYIDFGKIGPIMRDSHIEDAWCNGVGIPVYVYHTAYGNLITNITFGDDDEIDAFAMRVAHQSSRHISKSAPILDTVMHDGSRINITYGYEISPKGTSFSIRKQKEVPLTPLDLIAWKTFSSEIMAYFWLAMVSGKNILFCGGTASGKTSSMNAICMFIPQNIRVVTLEDTREIQLPHENWIPMVTKDGISHKDSGKIDLEDLLKTSLRQRPDYLLVGEVRGRESQILFQAMNAGHATCSTFHAGTPKEVINRFTNPPINVPVAMFTALDIISMQSNTYERGTERRRVSRVTEVVGVSNGVETTDTYIWNPGNDTFAYGKSTILEEIRNHRGWTPEGLILDLDKRKMFLEMLINKGIREYHEVFWWFDSFNKNSDKAISELDSCNSGKLNNTHPPAA